MTDLESQVLEALRRYAVGYQESSHRLAAWMGLPTQDGAALGEVMWAESEGSPLSPARLASRIGLTSGATSALLDRLEGRGLVSRSRESSDRRTVTLRATPAARERAAPFLGASADRLDQAISGYDDATLELVRAFLDRFSAILPGTDGA